jgi:hypothetical protein
MLAITGSSPARMIVTANHHKQGKYPVSPAVVPTPVEPPLIEVSCLLSGADATKGDMGRAAQLQERAAVRAKAGVATRQDMMGC